MGGKVLFVEGCWDPEPTAAVAGRARSCCKPRAREIGPGAAGEAKQNIKDEDQSLVEGE